MLEILAAMLVVTVVFDRAGVVLPVEAVARRVGHSVKTLWEGEVDGWVYLAREGGAPAVGDDRPSSGTQKREDEVVRTATNNEQNSKGVRRTGK